jgi:hypothetical protein
VRSGRDDWVVVLLSPVIGVAGKRLKARII